MVCCAGVYDFAEVRDKQEMQQAYDMGKKIS